MSEIEHTVKVLQLDDSFQEQVKALEAQGWQQVPGVLPVAVYHLIRMKQAVNHSNQAGGFGDLKIDDTKIHVIRDGQVVN